jgi:membrane protein
VSRLASNLVVFGAGPVERARRVSSSAWAFASRLYENFDRHDYLTYSAALAYYCLLSLFPLLIFLASMLAVIPIPNLFPQTLDIMAHIVPTDAMDLVRGVLRDALRTDRRLLSFSILGALYAASGGFSSLITTLNLAYGVPERRPYWKRRSIAFGLTIITGLLVILALIAIGIGPELGFWLAAEFHLRGVFASACPYLRWIVIAACTVFAVETIYFFGPDLRQRFRDQIPGATMAVLSWIFASWGLGWYVSRVAKYQQSFGTLGAVVGLMLWFYVTALALIAGAEINSELIRSRTRASAQQRLDQIFQSRNVERPAS